MHYWVKNFVEIDSRGEAYFVFKSYFKGQFWQLLKCNLYGKIFMNKNLPRAQNKPYGIMCMTRYQNCSLVRLYFSLIITCTITHIYACSSIMLCNFWNVNNIAWQWKWEVPFPHWDETPYLPVPQSPWRTHKKNFFATFWIIKKYFFLRVRTSVTHY